MRYTKLGFILFLFPLLISGNKVTVVNFEQLQSYATHKTNDTLYVMNFWATWCDPCVKELPAFQAEYKKYVSRKVKFIFVSMNSVRELTKVQNFTDNQKLGGQLLLLNGGNPNDWIDKVDSSWSGSIPATIMYKSGKKVYFREGEFTSESLEKIIQSKNK
ncbi:MAG TPA: TlpA disulfide reductase family protein [Bacteroidia bacterium]|jgi:thiol-disulfide isomerase/thioredoxin|nr:TlpA disulfide reductase family protein [Bacteroidia bacterium]